MADFDTEQIDKAQAVPHGAAFFSAPAASTSQPPYIQDSGKQQEHSSTMVHDTEIARRKSEHLRIVVEQDVSHRDTTMLEDVRFFHRALPELDFSELRLDTTFFNKRLSLPFMITSMTGGAEFAEKMNHGLARVAARTGIAFAVGSQRVMLRHPEVMSHFAVRREIPDGVLLGNIGAVQLLEVPIAQIVLLMEVIEADGICVHLNVAQELVQVDGNRRFRGLLDKIARLVEKTRGRILVKETGAGLSPNDLERLRATGVPVVDVSGSGGTSWTRVESLRDFNGPLQRAGEIFGDWGVPTAFSIMAARKLMPPETTIVASGGIRHGLDAARAIALGADIVGFARTVLQAFHHLGEDGAVQLIESMSHELKMAMLLTGSPDLPGLRKAPRILLGRLREYLAKQPWMDGDTL